MIFPNKLRIYKEQDPKFSTKTSVAQVRETLAVTIMLWDAAGRPAQLDYMEIDSSDERVLTSELQEQLIERYHSTYSRINVTDEEFLELIQTSPLFELQLEPLYMALGLIWRLADVSFKDNASKALERKGQLRFPKILSFTKNLDLLHLIFKQRVEQIDEVLLRWLGIDTGTDSETDEDLRYFLLNIAEEAVYRIKTNDDFVVFNMLAIYDQLLVEDAQINVTGTREPMGSLRVLRRALHNGMWPFLKYSSSDGVSLPQPYHEELHNYSARVSTFLKLSSSYHLTSIEQEDGSTTSTGKVEASDLQDELRASNVILYGVPGSGKSHAIRKRHNADFTRVEKVVFHPDYMNTDFIGQILPVVHPDRRITYDFVPGPFTRILKKAISEPDESHFLIVEEINRGNAPAIFGEIFQLLDRDDSGVSSDAITNSVIAAEVYGDPEIPIRIPNNLSLYATMNTADQNVFALDTAFQRRWDMEMVVNDIFSAIHAQHEILDTGVTWAKFATVINEMILSQYSSTFVNEDKRLGAYFIGPDVLQMSEDDRQRRRFPEKVIKYLWDDAFKLKRELIFKDIYKSLEQVLSDFDSYEAERRFDIFNESIFQELYSEDVVVSDDLKTTMHSRKPTQEVQYDGAHQE